MSIGTHAFVGSLRCGCGVAFVCEEPDFPKDTAKDVAGMIKRGLVVQRFDHASANVAFQQHCAEYPHTEWQRKIEAARAARESAKAVDAVDPPCGKRESMTTRGSKS